MKGLPNISQLKEIFNFKIPVCGAVLKLFTPTHNDIELITKIDSCTAIILDVMFE